ncbi:MAG: DUF72 domain-containing protein [Gemmatimonadetes bacterium]|nr:DUF72 domain-containing protein [Gemmatimonadota bacterium]
MAGTILLGTQGWNYTAWVGPFFPEHSRPADFLRLYARAFGTVEVDSTFYAIPPAKTVRGWADRVPGNFVFALKMPQEITHERRLADSAGILARFTERARLLGSKLGPILIQLGPDFGPDRRGPFEAFLALLPRDLRFAVEFRRAGWLARPLLSLLAEHRVALALVEGPWIRRERMLKLSEEPTADFTYVRWMGPDRRTLDYSRVQADRSEELGLWAAALAKLAARVTAVYGYFNNHFQGHSPHSARTMQQLLGQRPVEPWQLADQTELF